MKNLAILSILLFYHLGNSQLIDPFGKVVTHEIKMDKQDDGTYLGAIEWTTGGIDSLQRFVINGLDVKAPVMVRVISKAPDHNIDLSFHKKNWDKPESKISTNGNKYIDKVFRTMNTAGLGVSSKVAGIPYLITVKVGLQFPSTKSLIRITDDKEEYAQHMRKLGFGSDIFTENSASNSNVTEFSSGNNNTLIYIVIGLLVAIVLLLMFFLIKRKKSQTTTILILCFGFSQLMVSQNPVPQNVPASERNEVFIGYKSQNLRNQSPVPLINPTEREVSAEVGLGDGTFRTKVTIPIQSNSTNIELPREEAENIDNSIREADEEFDRDYRENMPGIKTEGDQRVLPSDRNRQELQQLRRQVSQLQQQVELLSQEDEQYEEQDDYGGEILLYCEDIQACQSCVKEGITNFNIRRAYFDFLQKFYLKKSSDLNDWVEWGNSISSLPGGGGMAWGPIYMYKVKPAIDNLKKAYSDKFDTYIELMEADLEQVNSCLKTENGSIPSKQGYETQMFVVVKALKASKINK